MTFLARLTPALTALAFASCAPLPTTAPSAVVARAEPLQTCASLYRQLDEAVDRDGVRDGLATRIEAFPYLRVDRLLASLAQETRNGPQFADWVQRLAALDRAARAVELANLSDKELARLRIRIGTPAASRGDLHGALDRCAEQLGARDLATAARRQRLRDAARVPDDYDTWKRVVGLYWLTRLPFSSGVRAYQTDVEHTFARDIDMLPVRGRLMAYVPPAQLSATQGEVAEILARASRNSLRIPEPDAEDLAWLFDTFAPVFLVDERDGDDRIGALMLDGEGRAGVDIAKPTVYRRVAHTRYGEQTLLQLVYSAWFPARPRMARSDLLGGHLDGVIWRVTLSPDGVPLVFDSIHNCGCYHQFFPTPRARLKPQPETLDEAAFVPQALSQIRPDERLVLRIESGTHYLQRVLIGASGDGAMRYAFESDDALRSLPLGQSGRRSAFRPDGIVPGSERGERYLFWPMGVREPGAMRQWGRHATAFVGRRHFDESRLMERYFALELN